MRIPRVFVAENIREGEDVYLTGKALQHVAKVLRLRAGARVILFDGRGGEWEAILDGIRRDHAKARLLAFHDVDREPPLEWHLVQGISRGERMDYTLQKCVELGVASIHPIEMKRTVVKLDAQRATRRLEHWQGVVTNACEQSGRTRHPPVHGVRTLDDFLSGRSEGLLLLLDPDAERTLDNLPRERPANVMLLAGPEGGFDASERERIRAAGGVGIRMGPRVLRTETAAVVAAALLLGRWGDLA